MREHRLYTWSVMDFLNPRKKKAHNIRLIVGYVLVAIALALATWLLAVLSSGYYYDTKTGTVIQNGLVFVSSQPDAADIFVNGSQQANNTNARLVLAAGQYSMVLKKNGYRNWSRQVSLQGGSVERLDYALLIPTKLATKDVELYSSQPSFASQSPDKHWLLVQQPGQLLKFDIMDLTSRDSSVTPINLPSSLITASTDTKQTWSLVEWAKDNRHVLLRHHFAGQNEFVIIDRQSPAASFNVNRVFKQNPAKVVLRNGRTDSFYLYNASSKTLQRADVNTGTTIPLINHVLAFQVHDDRTILYVSDQPARPKTVSLKLLSGSNTYTLRSMPATNNYLLAVARYGGHWYMVASAQNDNRTYVYRDPETVLKRNAGSQTLLPAIVLFINQPSYLSVSKTNHFMAVQSGKHFAIYDADSDRRFYYDLPFAVSNDNQAKWLDDSHLTIVTGSKATIFDYDGSNQQILVNATAGLPTVIDPDYRWLYAFGPSLTVKGRAAITRTNLTVR